MPMTATSSPLAHRGVISIGGEERGAFLQGLISNDISLCQQDRLLYAALLTPQGRFLHDLFITDVGDTFLIDCEAARAEDLLQRLSSYKLRARVNLANISSRFDVWWFSSGSDGLQDPRLPALGRRGIFEKGKAPTATCPTDASAYDRHRLELGIAEGSGDMIVGQSTLLDGNFDFLNGISWTKGCYIGQELTARMHHRALVKKRLFPVWINGAVPPAGSTLHIGSEEIGEMRSSNGDLGLALLNVERTKQAAAEGTKLTAAHAELSPYQPDWLKI